MTDQASKGNCNLTITTWMGLIYGMALSGWSGNLQQITVLKYRVSKLETSVA